MTEETKTKELAPVEKKERSIVTSNRPLFDTARFDHMLRVANMMAHASMIPNALRGENIDEGCANCLLVVNQAQNWNMDPFAVAQCAAVVHGKLCFEGKLVAAVIAEDPEMAGPLDYSFEGEGESRKITVSGTLKRNPDKVLTIEGTVGQWKKPKNDNWISDPDQMLVYRGARQWARRHNPQRLLGVYTADELADVDPSEMKDITPRETAPPPMMDEETGELQDENTGTDTQQAVEDKTVAEPETIEAEEVSDEDRKAPPPMDAEDDAKPAESEAVEVEAAEEKVKPADAKTEAKPAKKAEPEKEANPAAETESEEKTEKSPEKPDESKRSAPKVVANITIDMIQRSMSLATDMDELDHKWETVKLSVKDWDDEQKLKAEAIYDTNKDRIEAL